MMVSTIIKAPLATLLLLVGSCLLLQNSCSASSIRGAEDQMQRELQQFGIETASSGIKTDSSDGVAFGTSPSSSSSSSANRAKAGAFNNFKDRELQDPSAPTRNANVPGTTTVDGGIAIPLSVSTVSEIYVGAIQGERYRISESEGLLSDAFVSVGDLRVVRVIEETNPHGRLDWDSDGSFDYYPDDDFTGLVFWTYDACSTLDPTVCSSSWFDINVERDPLKPDRNPEANNDRWEVQEGERLRINSPGFFENDETGQPYNPLEICDGSLDRGGIREGRLTINGDSGGFEYRAQRCSTGIEYFRYKACYEDYPDMESDEVQVEIEVRPSDDRPNNGPEIPSYTPTWDVDEAEPLSVSESNGLLSNLNADKNAAMYVKRIEQESNTFPGYSSLRVDRDGSFRYDSISGELGEFTFRYEVCYEDWEDCVPCETGTARIQVNTNPNKPKTNPIPKSQAEIRVKGGQRYRGNVFDYVEYDSLTSSLKAMGYQKARNFMGTLNTEDDGTFEYGNAPVGQEAFSYTVCYTKWTDLCATGDITMVTTDTAINQSNDRNGIATLYEVYWAGQGTDGGCTSIQPSLTLYCQTSGTAAGILTLVNSGPNNSACRINAMGHLNCDATSSGSVHVECRDKSNRNPVRRQIVASLGSSPVPCFSAPFTTSHSIGIRSWCPNTNNPTKSAGWEGNRLNWCTETRGPTTELCTETASVSGFGFDRNVQPQDVVAQSTVDNQCIVQLGTPIPGSVSPTLAIAGDNNNPSSSFPLKQCEGDCDDDNDCAGELLCFQREGNEIIPGCLGTGVSYGDRDFCVAPYKPPPSSSNANPSRTDPVTLTYVGNEDGNDHASYPLSNCEGDCDSDDQCLPGLQCFSRESDESVPGCIGDNADLEGNDFCVSENYGK